MAGPFGDHGQELQLTVVVDGGDVLVLQVLEAGGDLVAAPCGPADQLVRNPGNLHHGPTPGSDGARLGRQPQRLADLRGHDLVVERGGGHGVLVQGQGVDRAPLPVQTLPLHGQKQMIMEQGHPRPRLVVTEARGDQTAGRPHPVDAVLAVPDHRHLVLNPLQHPLDRPLVRGLDHPPGRLIPQRPQQVDRRLRPEHEVDTGHRHPASEAADLERLLRGVALGEPVGLDPVRVRMPAPLAEEVPQLALGDFLAGCQSEHGQAAAHPSPGRDPGLLLGGAQRHAGRAAAVADNGLAQVVAVHLTGSDDLDVCCHADHVTRL
nr:hypothetical protein [Streptomyces caniscabiei]